MQRLLVTVFASSLLVACGGDDSTHGDLAGRDDLSVNFDGASGESDDMAPPSGLCIAGSGSCAAVATSIYNADFTGTGTLDTVDISTKKVTTNIDATLDPDTTLKVVNGELFVLMRDSGTVRIYDPSTYKVKVELPCGDTNHPSGSTYPEDFYVDTSGKIWVTLSGNPAAAAVGILDRTQPGFVTYVDIPTVTGDGDANPEANKFYACGSNLWVTQQSYSFDSNDNIVYQNGRLVPVNLTTKTVGNPITLTYKNPSDIRAYGSDCTDALVVSASSTTTSPDGTGGLERVNLTAGSTTPLATDIVLGGRPTFVVTTSTYAFIAEYFDPEANSMGETFLSSVKVIAWDLNAGTVHGDITGKFGNINFLDLQGGNLYLGAGVFSQMETSGKLPRGLYITPADGTTLTASPIDLQLTPSAIALP